MFYLLVYFSKVKGFPYKVYHSTGPNTSKVFTFLGVETCFCDKGEKKMRREGLRDIGPLHSSLVIAVRYVCERERFFK